MKPNTKEKLILLNDIQRQPGCTINQHDDARIAIDLIEGGLLRGYPDRETDPPSAKQLYVTRAGEVAIKEHTPSFKKSVGRFLRHNLTVAVVALAVGILAGVAVAPHVDRNNQLFAFLERAAERPVSPATGDLSQGDDGIIMEAKLSQ